MARALTKTIRPPLVENVKDFVWASNSQIALPASSILIGTGGLSEDAELYTAGTLVFDFANGTGDNGLDTGTEAGNTWYALYAVPSSVAGQYMLKATVRSPVSQPGPTGYTKWRYLGVFRNGQYYNSTNPTDIAFFTKNGPILNWYNPNNGNATGIRWQGSGGPSNNFSGSALNPTYTMTGGSGYNLPFDGALYGWTLTAAIASSASTSAGGYAKFWDGSFATSGVANCFIGLSGAPVGGNASLVWCDSSKVTQIIVNGMLNSPSGTFNWSLNLNMLYDPILIGLGRK